MEPVETLRELISVTVTQDMCEVRMERNVKVTFCDVLFSFENNVKTVTMAVSFFLFWPIQ